MITKALNLPANQINPTENIALFIEQMKQRSEGILDWAADNWPKIRFFRHIDGKPSDQRLAPTFVDFMKAYLTHRRSINPNIKFAHDGSMFRALESVLIQLNGDTEIYKCNMTALDETALLLRKTYSHGGSYIYIRRLKALATFLSDNQMITYSLKYWKSPVSVPRNVNGAVCETGDKRRKEKEPDKHVLDALGELFANNPDAPRDIFTTSLTALLMCAPSRGNEVLALTADAEIQSKDQSQYGWRFYSSKGYGADIKWIPSVMVPMAREAFARMVKLSQQARALALWLENGEDRFFRHEFCPDVSDTTPLSPIQAAQALGLTSTDAKRCRDFLRDKKLKSATGTYTLDVGAD